MRKPSKKWRFLFCGIFCAVDEAEFFGVEFADFVVRPLADDFVEFGADGVDDCAGAGTDGVFALGLAFGGPAGAIVHD